MRFQRCVQAKAVSLNRYPAGRNYNTGLDFLKLACNARQDEYDGRIGGHLIDAVGDGQTIAAACEKLPFAVEFKQAGAVLGKASDGGALDVHGQPLDECLWNGYYNSHRVASWLL